MRYVIIIILAFLTLSSYSQFWKKKINQVDENGKKHGYWIEYMDSEHTTISGKGRFEHGRETGKWKHYHFNGKRRLQRIAIYENGLEGVVIWTRSAER